jgi:hypothetical protein
MRTQQRRIQEAHATVHSQEMKKRVLIAQKNPGFSADGHPGNFRKILTSAKIKFWAVPCLLGAQGPL